jgi:hypothetical protein
VHFRVETSDAREWGRRQAEASPVWSEDKWRRVGAILGIELVNPDRCPQPDADAADGEDQAAA